jgi:hypothetical protein
VEDRAIHSPHVFSHIFIPALCAKFRNTEKHRFGFQARFPRFVLRVEHVFKGLHQLHGGERPKGFFPGSDGRDIRVFEDHGLLHGRGRRAYGITHDSITANICIEYFSTGFHDANLQASAPALNEFLRANQNPYLYAAVWGTIATWWVGLPLGAVLAFAGRMDVGSRPFEVADFLPRAGIVLGGTLAIALLQGLVEYISLGSEQGLSDLDRRYSTDAKIHEASYTYSVIGALLMSGYMVLERVWQAGTIRDQKRKAFEFLLDQYLAAPGEPRIRAMLRLCLE